MGWSDASVSKVLWQNSNICLFLVYLSNLFQDKLQGQIQTSCENISRVFWPLVGIAAQRKMALTTLEGNISIAYDTQAPPKSCPTKITWEI